MKYSDIPRTLKRYSFKEKMNILQIWSREIMNLDGVIDKDETGSRPFPWELETLLLFSVTAQEWQQKRFTSKDRSFVNMINCIRTHQHRIVDELKGTKDLVNELLVSMGAVQFEAQEYPYYKLYRYNWYFSFVNSKVNMPEIFQQKLGSDYKNYAVLAMTLWMILCGHKHTVPQELYTFILSQFPVEVLHLTITRAEYIKQLESITTCIDDYAYCLRPSYTYPFIHEQPNIYLPLPHLLMRSVTSAMLYRITQNDNHLAELIGKEVLEPYLYQIILRSELFDEVYPEQEYVFPGSHGTKSLTLDVLTRKGNHYIFFDSKMYAPRRDLRTFNQDAYSREIDRLAANCKQIYVHIRNRFPTQYNPFHLPEEINPDNVYGLAVLREDPRIQIDDIYKETAALLEIPLESSEYKWLCRHVGIISLSDVEKYCFTHSNLPDHIYGGKSREHLTDLWLTEAIDSGKILDSKFKSFEKELLEDCWKLLKKYESEGLINQI